MSKYQSFNRQLGLYGFKQTSDKKNGHIHYYRINFQKGVDVIQGEIKREKVNGSIKRPKLSDNKSTSEL